MKFAVLDIDKARGWRENSTVSDMVALPSTACKHPVVRIVARDEDAEFVECQKCGEVFDSVEFDDMALEEQEGLLTERSSE